MWHSKRCKRRFALAVRPAQVMRYAEVDRVTQVMRPYV